MTRSSQLSVFHWNTGEPSIFVADAAFRPTSITGKSKSQTATAAVIAFEQRHGRSPGTIADMAHPRHADSLLETRMRESRAKKARSATNRQINASTLAMEQA
jgi:hypothetical protein